MQRGCGVVRATVVTGVTCHCSLVKRQSADVLLGNFGEVAEWGVVYHMQKVVCYSSSSLSFSSLLEPYTAIIGSFSAPHISWQLSGGGGDDGWAIQKISIFQIFCLSIVLYVY